MIEQQGLMEKENNRVGGVDNGEREQQGWKRGLWREREQRGGGGSVLEKENANLFIRTSAIGSSPMYRGIDLRLMFNYGTGTSRFIYRIGVFIAHDGIF